MLPFLPGCATQAPTPPAAQPIPAHLVVANLTEYGWRIAITRSTGTSAADFEVNPRASHDVDLPGADYVIDQSVLAPNPDQGLARRISVRLEPGQTYRWQLVTLLSEPADAAGSQSPRP